MKSCSEMRGDAWRLVVRTKWLWRLAAVTMLLNAIAQAVMAFIGKSFLNMGISTWTEFAKAKFAAAQQGLGYAVPSSSVALQMTGASAFESFITYIFSAIFSLGIACVTLKAVRNDEDKWLKGSFEGFRRPLEAAWLLFLINVKIMLWSLLFVVPGMVAVYRYRQAWYMKARNPDWSASRCIAESCRLMDGWKWKAFVFDLSFLGWLVLAGAGIGVSLLLQDPLSGALSMFAAVFVLCYFFAGRAVFFCELLSLRDAAEASGAGEGESGDE